MDALVLQPDFREMRIIIYLPPTCTSFAFASNFREMRLSTHLQQDFREMRLSTSLLHLRRVFEKCGYLMYPSYQYQFCICVGFSRNAVIYPYKEKCVGNRISKKSGCKSEHPFPDLDQFQDLFVDFLALKSVLRVIMDGFGNDNL